jgi:hypothetical protein
MLLDLYLAGNFPKGILTELKAHLEYMLSNLHNEQNDLMSHVRNVTMTDANYLVLRRFALKSEKV